MGRALAGLRSGVEDVSVRWARAAVITSFAFLVVVWSARPWVHGDTPFVLDGTNMLLWCLSHRFFDACGRESELNEWGLTSPIGDWPLLQYVPDLVSLGLGGDSHAVRTRLLALLSVAAVVGSVALARRVLSRSGQAAWFWGVMVVVLSGPVLFYARTTAGEMLALGLLMGLVATTALRAPPAVVAVAALAAALTKETSYPFVVALGLLGLVLARRRTGQPIRRHVAWGAGGLVAALVLASLFNVVRFGSVLNTNYLEPELHTPGIERKLEYTLALFFSPSGGMLFFWPVATVLIAAACLLPILRRNRVDAWPALVLVAVVIGLSIGFASWWTPFGWSGYGPRLSLPWVLPVLLLALLAYGEHVGRLAARFLASSWRLGLVFAVALVFALPHIGHMWRPDAIGGFFRTQTPQCDAPWRSGVETWHDCHRQLLWFTRPMPVYALAGVRSVGGALTTVVVGLGLLSSLILLRVELAAERTPS